MTALPASAIPAAGTSATPVDATAAHSATDSPPLPKALVDTLTQALPHLRELDGIVISANMRRNDIDDSEATGDADASGASSRGSDDSSAANAAATSAGTAAAVRGDKATSAAAGSEGGSADASTDAVPAAAAAGAQSHGPGPSALDQHSSDSERSAPVGAKVHMTESAMDVVPAMPVSEDLTPSVSDFMTAERVAEVAPLMQDILSRMRDVQVRSRAIRWQGWHGDAGLKRAEASLLPRTYRVCDQF